MLVAKEHKKLLLNLNQPDRITAIIPGAKLVSIKGRDIVSVPHTLDVVRVLRNLGLQAPSPILHYYSWRGRYQPYAHQRETAEAMTLHPRFFCLNDMGSGKTVSALWAFDYLKEIGEVDWCVIISPLSTLERAWGDEVFRHFPNLQFTVLHGKHKLTLAQKPFDIYIINHDGLKNSQMLDILVQKEGNGLVIVDELAAFRNAGTQRWKALNRLVNGNSKAKIPPRKWVWGLTGTPIPTEPTDAWAQCRLIKPESVPAYFGQFRDAVMRQLTQFKWAPRPDALSHVHRVMQPAIRFKREDCIDLPPTTTVERQVELTPEQAALYKQMLAQFKAEFDGGQITAMNEAIKINKLLQIVCGVAYTDNDDIIIPAKPRVDEVMEVIEEAGAKVIVFVPLTGALNALAEIVRQEHEVLIVNGQTSKRQRDEAFSAFQSPHGPRVLIAQPATMAHGLSLTAANTIIWYAPINSNEIYQQANARIVRPGQKRNTLIVKLQGSEIERRMYARLERRGTTQGVLLDMFD